jgi:hypothetical protein
MDKLIALVIAVLATVFGYWTQNFVLDEVGLHSLSITEYLIAEVLTALTAGSVAAFRIFWE